ncbi:hypothetical protein [Colwellia echini]|uniref:RING-type E3 ubiquitin transferase n=1 Tax=Colwellia echini TaxID=1982103 RepID=A0ABY3MW48_9GAMM|nr:hypothetical protein [Colwellia echini]TYK65425.1 hypothetical protein CWS31_010030 [Colwellia echini]
MLTKYPKLLKLFKLLGSIILILAFFANTFAFFFIFIVGIIVVNIFKPSTKSNFLKLQAVLPTSSIRSLAVGLAEIQGKTKCADLIPTKIGNGKCIAYLYTVKRETKDSDGKSSFEVIDNESKTSPFFIADDTGKIEINTDGLDFVWLPEKGSYQSGNMHYTQRVLMPNEEVLLIGNVSSKNGKLTMEKDEHNNVFNLTLASSVSQWNTYKPLLNSLYVFGALCCLVAIVVIKSDVSIEDGVVFYSFSNLFG